MQESKRAAADARSALGLCKQRLQAEERARTEAERQAHELALRAEAPPGPAGGGAAVQPPAAAAAAAGGDAASVTTRCVAMPMCMMCMSVCSSAAHVHEQCECQCLYLPGARPCCPAGVMRAHVMHTT